MLCNKTDVLNACLIWARNACKRNKLDENNVNNLKNQLFYLIRFNGVNIEEFVEMLGALHEWFTLNDLADNSFMFKPNPRSRSLNHRDQNQELLCWRENSIEVTPYYIQNIESVWFTTNKTLWLNGFWCKGLLHQYLDQISVNVKLIIIEIDRKSSEQNKILFTTEKTLIKKIKTRISIKVPLIICPQTMYEIRMETNNNTNYFHCALWDSEVKMDDDVIVNFHRNLSIENSARRGLVLCLSFKRI